MFKKDKVFLLIKRIVFFIFMVILLLAASFPMQFFSYDLGIFYRSKLWILIYLLLIFLIYKLIDRTDKKRFKDASTWYEKRTRININWVFKLIIFIGIFLLVNGLISFIFEYLNFGVALNQEIVENELRDFPVKWWLYIHIILGGPLLEELVFRKLFMALFFTEDKLRSNILAILVSSLIFGLMHENHLSPFLIFYSLPGLLLALIYRYSKDIRFSILVHIINNLISVWTLL
ncbi:MAG: type II CAAX endopeptidase family protein [Peptoniphilaceae bacterium]|nr:type II CAAX endopeptidase family protein [Peptoniphilaceae bacterium]MDY6018284.1 type II CAAX endopeptidase family protein [Anaerococcus sp.]